MTRKNWELSLNNAFKFQLLTIYSNSGERK